MFKFCIITFSFLMLKFMVIDILAKDFIRYKIRLSKKIALLLKQTYYIICYSIAVSVSDSLQPYAPPRSLQEEEEISDSFLIISKYV